MALVLSLKLNDDFWVAGREIRVSSITDACHLELEVVATGEKHTIRDSMSTEVLEDVFISAAGFYRWGAIRIAIEAPRSIDIMRGDRFRAARTREARHGVS